MTLPYLQCGEVLNRYETLYFKPRNICDPASSNHHNSGLLHGKIISQVISQLRLAGSHNTNLGAVANGTLELYVFQLGGAMF